MEPKYTLEQFKQMLEYVNYRDLLGQIVKPGDMLTKTQLDAALEKLLRKVVA